MPSGFTGVSFSSSSVSFPRNGAAVGVGEGGFEEYKRVGLGVREGVAGNGGISGSLCSFRSLEIGSKEPVVDLVLHSSVLEGALAG